MKKKLLLIPFCLILIFSCDTAYTSLDIDKNEEQAVKNLIDQVSGAEMITTLTALSGPRHVMNTPAGKTLNDFQDYITGRLTGAGASWYLQDVSIDNFWYYTLDENGYFTEQLTSNTYHMNNIIAEKTGTNPELAPVLLLSHWDTVYTTPGINDNGSAVAACLEAADIFAGYSFERTIIYCFFAFEEQGMRGSGVYADSMKTLPDMVYNMDMISFTSEKESPPPGLDIFGDMPTTGNFIGIFTTSFSLPGALDFCQVIDTFVPELPYYMLVADNNINNDLALFDTFRSDHMPFWRKGVPALFLSDTAEMRDGSPYHRPGDTLDSINTEFMVQNTKAVMAAAALRAGIIIP